MVFFRIRWLRKLVRRNMRPIDPNTAQKWHTRLSFLYFFFAWNTFGAVLYMWKTGKFDYAEYYGLKTEQESKRSKAVATMEMLGIPKARVIRIENFKKVSDEEITNTILEEEIEDRNAIDLDDILE